MLVVAPDLSYGMSGSRIRNLRQPIHQRFVNGYLYRMRVPLPVILRILFVLSIGTACSTPGTAQLNLLLNGDFEHINTCTEYNAECGMEAWFYLKDVKAQMLENTPGEAKDSLGTGAHSFGIYSNWNGFQGFTPVIGTLLPCRLIPGHRYRFSGLLSAKINPQLIYRPAISFGPFFYVPGRPFSKGMITDSILQVEQVPGTDFVRFTYEYLARGDEAYLTLGSFVSRDSSNGKKTLIGVQTVSLVLDNLRLDPLDATEDTCGARPLMTQAIYAYDNRHKEMDYALYARGTLKISLPSDDTARIPGRKIIETRMVSPVTDTLTLEDIAFDFNQAILKPVALAQLQRFFGSQSMTSLDSIRIEGHTDSIGTEEQNRLLSRRRGEAVAQWLRNFGKTNTEILPPLTVEPAGETRPRAGNETPRGRSLNRRVELILYKRKSDR